MSQLLREIAEISAGQGAPQGDLSYCSDGIPFVKAGNMESLTSGGSLTDIQKVSEEVAKAHKLKLYPKGTILFAKSGMSCLKGYVYVLPQEAYVVSHLACITPKEDISEYLRYYFGYHKPNQLVKDAAYPSISLADIGTIEIDTKDEATRNHIISSLQTVEGIIKLRYKGLQYLDELIKARFVEMFGRVGDSKYPLVRLGDYAKLQGGYAFKSKDFVDEGVPLVQIGNVNRDYLEWDVINLVPNEYMDKYKEFALKEDDLVMAMTRPIIKSLDSVKIAKVADSDLPCLLNQRVGRFQVNKDLNHVFLEVLCKTNDFKEYVERMSGNSLQPNISSKQVEDYIIILPPTELQIQFASFVQQVDKSKVAIQKSLDETQLLFDSLMQEYFG